MWIIVASNQINCKIFRHGIYKQNYDQIGSHERKELCDQLFKDGLIYGCGKPFTFNGTTVEKCAYI